MIYAIQSVLYAHMRSNLLQANVFISTFDISLDTIIDITTLDTIQILKVICKYFG